MRQNQVSQLNSKAWTINFDVQQMLFYVADPLAHFLVKLTRGSVLKIALLSIIINGSLILILGIPISLYYAETLGSSFISLFDKREYPIALFGYLIYNPAIWTYYIWQPLRFKNVIEQLLHNGTIGKGKKKLDIFLQEELSVKMNNRGNLFFPTLLTLLEILLFVYLTIFQTPYALTPFKLPTWWIVNPFYYWVIWLPLNAILIYMVTWLVIRQIIIISSISKLSREFEIVPKPFHPDKCNGLGAIGDFTLQSTGLVVIFGIWLSYNIGYPLLFGGAPSYNSYTIPSLMLYLIAVPVLLIAPTWFVHKAMMKARADALEDVAIQIRSLLKNEKSKHSINFVTEIEQLEKKYRIIEREYRSWPFRPPSLFRFSFTALIPIISSALSLLFDFYLK